MKFQSKAVLKTRAKKFGLHISGDFIILHCGEDILSGIGLDYAPHHAYLWLFVLPKFDDISFLHMTLGERLFLPENSGDVLLDAIDIFNERICAIRSASDLVIYIDSRESRSEYAEWAKYLSLVRSSSYDGAEILERSLDNRQLSESIHEKYQKLKRARADGGWKEVQKALVEWAGQTETR